jgi:hypothetical protein
LAVLIAVAAALGEERGPFKPRERMRVSLLNVEDDDDEQKRRLSATLRQFGKGPGDLVGHLMRLHPKRSPVLYSWKPDPKTGDYAVFETHLMEELEAHVKEFQPHILILDPYVELHTAPENDNNAQSAVIVGLRMLAQRHHCALLLVHHARKGAPEEAGDQDRARGASAVVGACRTVITCTVMGAAEAQNFMIEPALRHQYVRVDGAKSNYGAGGKTNWFEKLTPMLDNDEITAAISPWNTPATSALTPEAMATLEIRIAKGAEGGEPWSPGAKCKPYRSIKTLMEEFGFEDNAHGRKSIRAALKQLGVVEAPYWTGKNNSSDGLRTKNGLPAARWKDGTLPEPEPAIVEPSWQSDEPSYEAEKPDDLFGGL